MLKIYKFLKNLTLSLHSKNFAHNLFKRVVAFWSNRTKVVESDLSTTRILIYI